MYGQHIWQVIRASFVLAFKSSLNAGEERHLEDSDRGQALTKESPSGSLKVVRSSMFDVRKRRR